MKNDFRQNIAAILSAAAAGAVFIILLFLLEWSVFIDIPAAAGTYVGLYLLTKPRRRIGGMDIDLIENGEELEQKLLEAKDDHESIKRSVQKIGDLQVKNEAEQLVGTSAAIIEYLENDPAKIRQARQFIDYYQDCASKLLSKYIGLQDANIETEEIIRLKKDTRSALSTLNKAFSCQFEKLMRGELTDMQAEIDLLEQTVKMEMNK
ncbi:MAG: 5-bromo-4-chloroindolyl phosphate hydrolysis family protein [Oscillospiraceae bacterium]